MGVAGRDRSLGYGGLCIGFRAAGFILLRGSLGFRFWRVLPESSLGISAGSVVKLSGVGVRG